jgi:hypothetical protein
MLPDDFHNFSQLLQEPAKSSLNHNRDGFYTLSNPLRQISYSVGTDGFFLEIKRPETDADLSPLCSAEIKNKLG